MKAKFVRVATKDRLILQGLLYEPEKTTIRVIIHIHGMAGNFYENRFLDTMSYEFTGNNWAFLTVNTRGHDYIADFPVAGKTEKYRRIGNFREKFEECVYDIKAWLDFTETRGYKETVLQGHSLGAVKVAYYLAKTQDKRVTKLILASPSDMIGQVEAEKDHQELLKLSKKMIKERKGDKILPKLLWEWYYLSAKTYIDFGKRDNPIDVFSTYERNKPSILSEIRVPILALFGSKDDAAILPLKEALEIIGSKAVNCPKFETGIIEGAPHSYFGHEKEMAKKIMNWLSEEKFKLT